MLFDQPNKNKIYANVLMNFIGILKIKTNMKGSGTLSDSNPKAPLRG
jgi:hypothetical protein